MSINCMVILTIPPISTAIYKSPPFSMKSHVLPLIQQIGSDCTGKQHV